MKANKHYKRFRHVGKDLISIDFALFAMAFNIGKMLNRKQKKKKKAKDGSNNQYALLLAVIIKLKLLPVQKYSFREGQCYVLAA
jgi:hypothetical protein